MTGVAAEAEECGPLIEKAQKAVRLTTFGTVAAGLALFLGLVPGLGLVAVMGLVAAVGLLVYRNSNQKAASAAMARLDQCRAREASLNQEISGAAAAIEKIGEEIVSRAQAYPEVAVAPVRLAVEVAKVGERTVLLDNAGFHEDARLQVLDPRPIKKKIKKIRPEIDKLRNVPAMLSVQ